MRVDAVVFDVDGVLVDVANSYRRAIVETVEHVHGETIERADVQAFKDAGGFNNDWALTDAVALFVLARREGLAMDVQAYTDAIADRGGGVPAAQAVIEAALPDGADAVEARWNRERLRAVFQALYLGSDLYRELEGESPPFEAPGYIHDEPVLIEPDTVETLQARFSVGVFTGRPAAEATIALERAGVRAPTAHRITMDDDVPGKPDPHGLLLLAERLSAAAVAFVGDTIDDIRTAAAAGHADRNREYFGIGVLTGGLSGDDGRRRYESAGADLVVGSVNDLPARLRRPE